MSAAVRTGIKWVAKVSAMSVLASSVAVLGSPAASGLAVVVIVLILALCWVLKDRDRSDHLTKVIYACNGVAAPQPAERLDPAKPKITCVALSGGSKSRQARPGFKALTRWPPSPRR